MLAGCTPRLFFSQKDHLAKPNLPKYVPFTQEGGSFVLKFNIPTQVSLPPQCIPTTSHSIVHTVPSLSLQALSLLHCPFAGLSLPVSSDSSQPPFPPLSPLIFHNFPVFCSLLFSSSIINSHFQPFMSMNTYYSIPNSFNHIFQASFSSSSFCDDPSFESFPLFSVQQSNLPTPIFPSSQSPLSPPPSLPPTQGNLSDLTSGYPVSVPFTPIYEESTGKGGVSLGVGHWDDHENIVESVQIFISMD